LSFERRNLTVSAQGNVEAHQNPIGMKTAIQRSFITTLIDIHSQDLLP